MKDRDCSMGARVALVEGKAIKRGHIVGTVDRKVPKTPVIIIEWDNGAVSKVPIAKLVPEADVIDEVKAQEAKALAEEKARVERFSSFEKEFQAVFDKVHPEIQAKIEAAAKLIDEATDLSEKYGVPFRPKHGTPFRMSYMPDSLEKKFPALKNDKDWELHEIVNDLTGAYGGEYSGWQSSQVC